MKYTWILIAFFTYAPPIFSVGDKPQAGEEEEAPIKYRVVNMSGKDTCGAALVKNDDGITKEYNLVFTPNWGQHDRITLGKKKSHIKLGKEKTFTILGFEVTLKNVARGQLELISAQHIKSGCPPKISSQAAILYFKKFFTQNNKIDINESFLK